MEPSVPLVAGSVPLPKGADFWIRAAARIIDTVFLTIFAGITGAVVGVVFGLLAGVGAVPASTIDALGRYTFGSVIVALAADALYHAICESMHGATLGKLICGLLVLRPDGSKVSFGSALGRSLAFLVDGLFFGIVGYSSMKSSDLRQRYGDKWSNTMVVRRAEYPTRQWPSGGQFAITFLLALFAYGLFTVFSLVIKLM